MNSTQMPLPPGLALGIAANEAASQGQFWERTQSGNPTVTAKNLAAASQRDIAAQAGVAQQIEAMKMAQMQQAIQRMAAKQTSSPMASGIGSLPGDVAPQGMAEGGVVGYSGTGPSFVANLTMEEIDRMSPDMRKAYFKEMLARRNAPIPTTPPAAPTAMSAKPGVGIASTLAKKLGPLGLLAELFTTSDEDIATLENARVQREAAQYPEYADANRGRLDAPTPSAPVVPADTVRFMQQYANVPGKGRREVAAPADRKKPAATQGAAPAMALPFPDTRESTAVNPSEAAIQFALARGDIKAWGERLSKPTPETPEQQAYRKAQEEQYSRGIAGIEAQRKRFEDAEAARKRGLSNQERENLISFLTRVGGAGSLARGLGQAQIGMEPIIAAQRAAEKAANEKKIQYFDLLDQRKETVEDRRLAMLKGDADRVAAETARLRAVDAEIAKLQIGLGEKQATQQLTGEQAMQRLQTELAAREKEAAAGRATQLEAARIGADRTPAEVRLMEWLRDPKNKKLYEDIQSSKRVEDRNLKLYELYMKNKLMLGDMSFEDFAAGFKEGTGATGASAAEFKVLGSRPK